MKVTVSKWGMLYDFTSGIDLCRALYTVDNHNLQRHIVCKKPEDKKTAYEALTLEFKRKYGDNVEIVFDEKSG
jgi:hypothetical protein